MTGTMKWVAKNFLGTQIPLEIHYDYDRTVPDLVRIQDSLEWDATLEGRPSEYLTSTLTDAQRQAIENALIMRIKDEIVEASR